MEDKIYLFALQNAVKYEGTANAKGLFGRVMGEFPEARKNAKKTQELIEKAVNKVNKFSLEKQRVELEKLAPGLSEEKKKEKREGLKPLKNAVKGKVVMRFAPSPSGPAHIGHALVVSLNSEYCRIYNGRFILRIEDTNSDKIFSGAYEMLPDEINWVTKNNIFKTIVQSDRLGLYYDTAEELVKNGHAYVCTCDAEKFKELKIKMQACQCRDISVEENIDRYHNMFINYKPGDAVIRLKTDIMDKNPAMRDFPIMRINDSDHPRMGKKHKVWPLMNLSVAVDDYDLGLTHVLRAKEHMDNEKRQRIIFKCMGWEPFPETIYIGRVNFEDLRVSCSKTMALIKEGVYSGWDDIRLPFLAALRRRGLRPGAFIKYAIEMGVTEHDKSVTQEDFFKTLYAFNKEIIDKEANRFFFIDEPKQIKIEKAPDKEVELLVHPDFLKRGKRKLVASKNVYITAEDFDNIESGKLYRLIDAFNFEKKGNKLVYHSESYEEFKKMPRGKIIHWLPVSNELAETEVLMPDGTKRIGFAEPKIKKLMIDNIVQFERFGFARFDSKEADKMIFWFAHR